MSPQSHLTKNNSHLSFNLICQTYEVPSQSLLTKKNLHTYPFNLISQPFNLVSQLYEVSPQSLLTKLTKQTNNLPSYLDVIIEEKKF